MPTLSLHPPYHRVERAWGPDGRLHVLAAPHPEQGWPLAWVFVPMCRAGPGSSNPAEAAQLRCRWVLAEARPLWLPFSAVASEPVSRAQRLALDWPPSAQPQGPGPQSGQGRRDALLCLLAYGVSEGESATMTLSPSLQTQLDACLQACIPGHLPDALGHALVELPVRNPQAPSETLTFVLASCQFPPHLLDRASGDATEPRLAGVAEHSLARLVRWCGETPEGRGASLLILTGDAIYADPTYGLFDPRNAMDRFDRRYDRLKSGTLKHLPHAVERIVSAPDDHEFEEKMEPGVQPGLSIGAGTPGLGVRAQRWARQAAWNHTFDPIAQPHHGRHFWHAFEWRGAAFFVADTRTEREHRSVANFETAQMLSLQQREAISSWLRATQGKPRFFVSGAMLLPRRRASAAPGAGALRSDAWCGYPASLAWLLGELWAQSAHGVVFLSGDEHRSGCVTATLYPEGCSAKVSPLTLHSIHSSGLYVPWSFTAAHIEDFEAPETIGIDTPQGVRLTCQVQAWSDAPGDGFATLTLRGRHLNWSFSRAWMTHDPTNPYGENHRPGGAVVV
jgi:alkaline phosphatase D